MTSESNPEKFKGKPTKSQFIFHLDRKSSIWSFLYLFFLISLFFRCASTYQIKQTVLAEDPIIRFRSQIDDILRDSLLHQTKSGLKIVSLETGETLYTHDSHILFQPASNMKLLTTAVALKQLGPNFKFKTTLSIDTNSIENGTIKGNLYLKGYGNPDLTTDDFRHITSELKSKVSGKSPEI